MGASEADSDAASVQSGSSAGSDASDASGVSNGTDTSEVSQTGKKRPGGPAVLHRPGWFSSNANTEVRRRL